MEMYLAISLSEDGSGAAPAGPSLDPPAAHGGRARSRSTPHHHACQPSPKIGTDVANLDSQSSKLSFAGTMEQRLRWRGRRGAPQLHTGYTSA